MALTDKLKAIANAIRGKTGSTDLMTLDEMPTEISNIQTETKIELPYAKWEIDYVPYIGLVPSVMYFYGIDVYNFLCSGNEDLEQFIMMYTPDIQVENYATVEKGAFAGCTSLRLVVLPEGMLSIDYGAFKDCTALRTITLPSTLTDIDATAFEGCTNLTTINVPWSEGEVANAPWGATNATIHYNYVEST